MFLQIITYLLKYRNSKFNYNKLFELWSSEIIIVLTKNIYHFLIFFCEVSSCYQIICTRTITNTIYDIIVATNDIIKNSETFEIFINTNVYYNLHCLWIFYRWK